MSRILVTSMGGSGSNNFVKSVRMSPYGKTVEFLGTHADRFELACSVAERNYLVAYVRDEEEYIEQTAEIIRREDIDLITPNSDEEVLAISRHRDDLGCRTFLPDHEAIVAVQDKFWLHGILKRNGVHTAQTYEVDDLAEIEKSLEQLPRETGRFWIRVKRGSGSMAATWVKTAEQARKWIDLWRELQGVELSDFIISEFLPGRDFAVHTLWKDGELLAAKVCERLAYFFASMRLSGMSSTPAVAMTLDNRQAINESIKAIKTVSQELGSEPNGIYELDLKENASGEPCITEINIGRFFMISPIFMRTGQINSGELYLRIALGQSIDRSVEPIDVEPNVYMIRGLDKEVTLVRENEFQGLFERPFPRL